MQNARRVIMKILFANILKLFYYTNFAFQFIFSNQCELIKTYRDSLVCQSIDLSRSGKSFIHPVDIRPIFKLFRYDRCPPLTGSFRSQYVFYWVRSSRENVIGNRKFYAMKAEENSFCAGKRRRLFQ